MKRLILAALALASLGCWQRVRAVDVAFGAAVRISTKPPRASDA